MEAQWSQLMPLTAAAFENSVESVHDPFPLFKRRIGVFAKPSVGNDLRYAEQVREFIANAVSWGWKWSMAG